MVRPLRRRRIAQRAVHDGELGIDLGKSAIEAALGPRPVFNGETYAAQGFVLDDLRLEPRANELHEARGEEAEAGITQVLPVLVLWAGLVFATVVEILACSLLLGLLGMQSPDRVILGASLALLLIALTSAVRRAFRGGMSLWVSGTVLTAYGLFLVSAAMLRISDLAVEGEPTAFADFMASVLLVLAAAGPAWIAELCRDAIAGSTPRRNFRRRLARDQQDVHRRVNGAMANISRIAQAQQTWDEESARLAATYHVNFHRAAARISHHKQQRRRR